MVKLSSPRRIGRPPEEAGGQRVKDYPQISVRVPKLVRAQVSALARAMWSSQSQC